MSSGSEIESMSIAEFVDMDPNLLTGLLGLLRVRPIFFSAADQCLILVRIQEATCWVFDFCNIDFPRLFKSYTAGSVVPTIN